MHGGGHKGLPSISPDGGPTVCLAELHHLHFDANYTSGTQRCACRGRLFLTARLSQAASGSRSEGIHAALVGSEEGQNYAAGAWRPRIRIMFLSAWEIRSRNIRSQVLLIV